MHRSIFKPTTTPPFNTHRRASRSTVRCSLSSATSDPGQYTSSPQQQNASSLDASATVVEHVAFRVTMAEAQAAEAAQTRTTLRILFVSESGVCRGPLAAAAFIAASQERGLDNAIECSAAASRDYNVDGPAEPAAISAAQCLGWSVPPDYTARVFLPSSDLVRYDLILVVDKFTAADVLREASVFDTIYLDEGYSGKVRCLGDFHPSYFGKSSSTNGSTADNTLEIDDPLYGNIGGMEEVEAVLNAAETIQECCDGLVDWLAGLQESANISKEGLTLRGAVAGWLEHAEGIEWMKPPLLSPR